jgi:cytochrome c-type biogenesis protein CcmH/NrfG
VPTSLRPGIQAGKERELEQRQRGAERALALDPNNTETLAGMGQILASSGQPRESIRSVEKALRLNPRPCMYSN